MNAGSADLPIGRFGAEVAPLLAVLHGECFAEAWSAETIALILGAPRSVALVAGTDPPAGFALARIAADEAELLSLAVAPFWRRRAIGRRLLAATLHWAREGGATTMFLEVGAGNWAALALYQSAGFAAVGRRPGYYRGAQGREDALVMRRALADFDAKV